MEAPTRLVAVCTFIDHQCLLLCCTQPLVHAFICHHFLLLRRHRFVELRMQHDTLQIVQPQLSHALKRIQIKINMWRPQTSRFHFVILYACLSFLRFQ